MTRRLGSVVLVLVSVLALAQPGHADTVLEGSSDGAFFRIVVPTNWNGDLVVYNHGFSLAPPAPVTDLGPLAPLQLAEGYAVAASSYSSLGWAMFDTRRDLRALFKVFRSNFGKPRETLVSGASLGGLWIIEAESKADAESVYQTDPFFANGLRAKVEVFHYVKANAERPVTL